MSMYFIDDQISLDLPEGSEVYTSTNDDGETTTHVGFEPYFDDSGEKRYRISFATGKTTGSPVDWMNKLTGRFISFCASPQTALEHIRTEATYLVTVRLSVIRLMIRENNGDFITLMALSAPELSFGDDEKSSDARNDQDVLDKAFLLVKAVRVNGQPLELSNLENKSRLKDALTNENYSGDISSRLVKGTRKNPKKTVSTKVPKASALSFSEEKQIVWDDLVTIPIPDGYQYSMYPDATQTGWNLSIVPESCPEEISPFQAPFSIAFRSVPPQPGKEGIYFTPNPQIVDAFSTTLQIIIADVAASLPDVTQDGNVQSMHLRDGFGILYKSIYGSGTSLLFSFILAERSLYLAQISWNSGSERCGEKAAVDSFLNAAKDWLERVRPAGEPYVPPIAEAKPKPAAKKTSKKATTPKKAKSPAKPVEPLYPEDDDFDYALTSSPLPKQPLYPEDYDSEMNEVNDIQPQNELPGSENYGADMLAVNQETEAEYSVDELKELREKNDELKAAIAEQERIIRRNWGLFGNSRRRRTEAKDKLAKLQKEQVEISEEIETQEALAEMQKSLADMKKSMGELKSLMDSIG